MLKDVEDNVEKKKEEKEETGHIMEPSGGDEGENIYI